MNIIHVFWSPVLDSENNSGQFYLWVESSTKSRRKNLHPYQVKHEDLAALILSMKWDIQRYKPDYFIAPITVQFPSDKDGDGLLSPLIANLCNLDDKTYSEHLPQTINAFRIVNPFSLLKDLNYQQFSFEENMILGDDAKFWIQMLRDFSHVVKKDDYIPAIVAVSNDQTSRDNNITITDRNITYRNKWEIVSAEFNAQLKRLAHAMPISACLGNFSGYDKEAALHHVTDVLINELIAGTSFSQKTNKEIMDTAIDGCFIGYDKSNIVKNKDWINGWANWRAQLQYEQFGADFDLCFRLIEAEDEQLNDWAIALQMQSKKDPSFFIDLNDYWQNKDHKSDHFRRYFGEDIDRQLLLQLGYASRIYPLLENVFNTRELTSLLPITESQALLFLREEAWKLKSFGYHIIVPAWWTEKGRNRLRVKLNAAAPSEKTANPVGYIGLDGLIDFNYTIAMGDQQISPEEWQWLMDAKSELVFFRGEWISIDKDEIANIQTLVDQANKNDKQGNIQTLLQKAADDEHFVMAYDDHIANIMQSLQEQDAISLIEPPKDLKATLRPYQLRGLSWLAYLERLGMNPCLADDMGLGKTMQIIALLLAKPRTAPALLIAPTSVIGSWHKELQKFAPSLRAIIHHGTTRAKLDEFTQSINGHDIVITSYGLVRRDKALFDKVQWSRLIIDEAQNIKNPTAAQTKAIFSMKADNRIALTGTPIENRLMDLWSIFNFLNPGLLDSKTVFRRHYELPVQRENNQQKKTMLKNIVSPFILRRLKTDKTIISDLPDKIEQKVYCELSIEQASLYQLIVNDIKSQLDNTDDAKSKKMVMISALLRLKQCCNHPAQYLQDGSDFSPERSIKLQRLIETTKEAIQNNESILIFSQFTDICEKLQQIIKNQLGYTTHYLHGKTSRKQRETMIEAFQDPTSPASVFILSLKAGGVGITLTKANHVIHFDRWWNPAVENQATDRAYRIGQQKTVFAHKFITLGTIEEKIDAMLEDKQALADGIIGADESWLTQLSSDNFIKMIQLTQGAA